MVAQQKKPGDQQNDWDSSSGNHECPCSIVDVVVDLHCHPLSHVASAAKNEEMSNIAKANVSSSSE